MNEDILEVIKKRAEEKEPKLSDAPIEYNNQEAYCWISGFNAGYTSGQLEGIEMMLKFFDEWLVNGDYRLNPHCVEDRWRHKDVVSSGAPYPDDGITTIELLNKYLNDGKE